MAPRPACTPGSVSIAAPQPGAHSPTARLPAETSAQPSVLRVQEGPAALAASPQILLSRHEAHRVERPLHRPRSHFITSSLFSKGCSVPVALLLTRSHGFSCPPNGSGRGEDSVTLANPWGLHRACNSGAVLSYAVSPMRPTSELCQAAQWSRYPHLPRWAVSYLLDTDPEPLLPTGLLSSSSHRLSGRTSSRGRLPI